MSETFNQTLFFENIYYLIKKMGKKIGKVESETGVSPGYISRTSKEGNSKPGIDFIMSVAKNLNVSVEALLKIDFTKLTPTEEYLLNFFQKLSVDTIAGKLEWEVETAADLKNIECDINGNPTHRYFDFLNFKEEDANGNLHDCSDIVFISNSFRQLTVINGDCFKLRLKNGAWLSIWNFAKRNFKNVVAKEVWIDYEHMEFIYGTFGESKLSGILESLYLDIAEDLKHPKVNKSARYVIDAFLRDDFEDDKKASSVDDFLF